MDATKFEDCYVAGGLAHQIYNTSFECLMAHSIRAVEKYLRDFHNFDTQIVLEPNKNVRDDTGRLSWCSVASNSGNITYIYFQEDADLEKSRKRFCIAHELYHVIWSVGSSSSVPRDKAVESTCDVFANDLCRMH